MEPALQGTDLSVTYRSRFGGTAVDALRAVSLTIAPGEIVGVLGPNGSGKSTLLRILAGLLVPNSGHARVLDRAPDDRSLRARVGYQPEQALPFPQLSGREHLLHMGALLGMPPKGAAASTAVWLERLGLQPAAHRRIRTYSTGMERRLALAAALLPRPNLLLLDEPTAGLDPIGSRQVMEILREEAERGVAVLLASHHLQEVEQLCDRVLVLVDGAVRAAGSLDELLGTGDEELVVHGLDATGMEQLLQTVAEHGGEVVRSGRNRRHLFVLFRDLAEDPES